MNSNTIVVKPLSIARTLGKFALFFIIASIAGQSVRFITGHGRLFLLLPLFDLNQELNFPSYFSMFILLLASILLTVISIFEKRRASIYARHWGVLALGFLYISIDEIISLHEAVTKQTREVLSSHVSSYVAHLLYYAWIVPAVIILIFLAIYFYKFLLHLPIRTRRAFIISGLVYIFGAVVMEMIGGYYDSLHGKLGFIYFVLATVEESLEMIGVIIFIWALLEYISDNFAEIQFKIDNN